MLKSTIFIFIIIQCIISCSLVLSNEVIYSERDINHDTKSGSEKIDEFKESMDQDMHEDDLNEIENFIDPHSFFYNRQKKVMENTVISSKKSDKMCNQEEALKKSIEECERLKIYYMRLIKVLLINSNLKKGEFDDLEGHIFIKGTEMQIEKLRKVEIGHYSLKEIDLILNEILLEPSFIDTIDFNNIIRPVFQFVNSYIEVLIIASGAMATLILCRIMPYRRMMFFIIVIGLSASYFMTYLELLTNAEIKLAATQVQYAEMPAICKPDKMNWMQKVSFYFFGNNEECEKYYEAKMANPNLQVTPVLVLSHLFCKVLLYPISPLGESMSKFITNATAELPFLLQYFVKTLLFILLPILTVIGIIFLRINTIEFGFLRGFTFSFSTPKTNALPPDDIHKRQTIELIREIIGELPVNIQPKILENIQRTIPENIQPTIPENIQPTIPANNYLLNTAQVKENDSPVENATEKPCKSMPDKSLKEPNFAGGDADINNLYSKESEQNICKCEKSFKINNEIGSGDA